MAAFISHTSFDSRDAYAQSVFWGAVLGFAPAILITPMSPVTRNA
jgi:hypothetical protein